MYTDEEFQAFISTALQTEDQSDIDTAFSKIYKKYPNVSFAVSLANHTEYLSHLRDIRFLDGGKAVTPFFETNQIYFINDQIFENMYFGGEHQVLLDSSIMLDTNLCTYISSFMNRKNIPNYQEVVNIINQILKPRINFDFIYYLVENYKQIFDIIDKKHSMNSFWNALNPHMRENLISLMLFKSIDRELFSRTMCTEPKISKKEAEEQAKDLAYDFYLKSHPEIVEQLQKRFLITKIMLYKTIYTKFSSKKSPSNKSKELIRFMIEDMGVYVSRDLYMAISYFNSPDKIPILNKINKSKNFNKGEFNNKVDNIAWDLMIPRFVELIASHGGKGDFLIPFFLTFDTHLEKLLDSYKAKIFIYENDKFSLTSIPSWQTSQFLHQAIDAHSQKYFIKDTVEQRRSGRITLNQLENLLIKTRSECISIME